MIMGPESTDWKYFRRLLRDELWRPGHGKKCTGTMGKPMCRKILQKHFPGVDIPATFAYFEKQGGYCDCEVLLNVT